MIISNGMLAYFIFGLNAVIDGGEKITLSKAYELVENQILIRFLKENYGQYWEWVNLEGKYQNELCNLLFEYQQYIEEDSFRKFGIKSNGFAILSSLGTQILVDRKTNSKEN